MTNDQRRELLRLRRDVQQRRANGSRRSELHLLVSAPAVDALLALLEGVQPPRPALCGSCVHWRGGPGSGFCGVTNEPRFARSVACASGAEED